MATQGKILVYKRQGKKGITYTYRIEAGRDPVTGKRKCITKSGFKTAKEARAAAQPVINKLLLGENVIESQISFIDFIDEWYSDYRHNLKLPTQRRYKYVITFLKNFFGYKKMKDITAYDYQNLINTYAKDKKDSTVENFHQVARKVFIYANRYNIIINNPALKAILPKDKILPPKNIDELYLTKDELKNVLEYLSNYSCLPRKSFKTMYVYAICATLAYTGVRVAEACALLWEDVDFNNKTIYIKSSMFAESYNNYKRQDTPKNKSSIRKIIIGDTLISILKAWKIKQLEQRLKYRTQSKRDKEDYVFTKYSRARDWEQPVIPPALNAVFRNIDNIHIFKKHLHAHLFRHTHVSLLAEAGVPLEVIQERLGHDSDETTRKIYLHITDKLKNDAAAIFERYMQN